MLSATCSLLTQVTLGFGRCPPAGSSPPLLVGVVVLAVTAAPLLAVVFPFREGSASTRRAMSFSQKHFSQIQRLTGSGDLYRLPSWRLTVNIQSIRLNRRSPPLVGLQA